MINTKILLLSVLSALSVKISHAESTLTLGAGVGGVEQPYKGYDSKTYLIPAVSYDGDSFWFRGLGGGYYLWNDTADTLSLIAYWSPVCFRPDNSINHQLRQLDKRKSTMMAGMSWSHYTPYGFLRSSLAADVLDNSKGVVADVAWLYRYANSSFVLTPGIGVEWSSQNHNNYYYGVSRRESVRTGLERYQAGNGWAPYLEVSVNYNFLGNLSIYGTVRYTRLSEEVVDSPMVNKLWSGLFSTGITYRF